MELAWTLVLASLGKYPVGVGARQGLATGSQGAFEAIHSSSVQGGCVRIRVQNPGNHGKTLKVHDSDDLITVFRAANYAHAYIVRNALEAAGIECQVSEANEPFAGLNVVEPDVMVRARDRQRAEEIIAECESQAANDTDDDDEDIGDEAGDEAGDETGDDDDDDNDDS